MRLEIYLANSNKVRHRYILFFYAKWHKMYGYYILDRHPAMKPTFNF